MRSVVLCMRMLYNVNCGKQRWQQAAGKAPARGAVEQTGAAPGAAQEATNCGKVSHELLIFRSAARTVLKSAAAKSQLKCNHCAYLMCVIATQPAPLSIHSSSTLRYTVTCLQFQLPLPFTLRLSPWHSGTLALHTLEVKVISY